MLKALGHVNIVSLLDVFQASGRVNLVFEYVERTVLDCLKLQPRGLGDATTRRIMWQLVKAVEYLHTQKACSFPSPYSFLAISFSPAL